MTDKTYGGKRRGAGRKADGKLHRLVAMTFLSEEEYRLFLKLSTPRSRVEILMEKMNNE